MENICDTKFLMYLKDPHFMGTVAALSLATAAYYTWTKQTAEDKLLLEHGCQTIELPGPEHIRINAKFPTALTLHDLAFKTIHEIFLQGVSLSGDNPFLGSRPDADSDYVWATYNEIHTKAKHLGSALYELGLRKGSCVGISGVNKCEWVIVDQGAAMFSMVLVPIYDTLGEQGMELIIEQTESVIMFCDINKVDMVLSISEKSDHLRTLVTFGTLNNAEISAKCEKRGIRLMTMDEILEFGKQHYHEKMPPSPEDLAIVCYTSGTTGPPKGVMLTHYNIAANIFAVHACMFVDEVRTDDCMISYLPLSHMYERCAQYAVMRNGGRVGFFRGNIKELVKDIQCLRPTIFPAVPRLLNALYDKITGEISKSWVKSLLVKTALSFKKNELKRGIVRQNSIWDKLVFNKIQALLGGRVRILVTGAAPLSSTVKTFLKCAFGCHVVEGYGQTEVCALVTATSSLDPSIGHVGSPAHCKIKLVDVPELDYFASQGTGEVCIKGPSVFVGYFKNPEKTEETLDENGWCHTGDVGKWLQNGTLTIIDRKKHIFKLSQGEYIAPEKIENVYLLSPLVAQLFVTGYSTKSCTVALVVPDPDMLMRWAAARQITGSIEELCESQVVKNAVHESMRELGATAGLNSLEQVKGIHMVPEPFTIESGFLTPTMKLKRKKVQDAHVQQLDALYEEIDKKYQHIKSSVFK